MQSDLAAGRLLVALRIIFASVAAGLAVPAARAQSAADTAAIRAAALDYAEGWYAGDGDRMERALHPELAKRIAQVSAETGRTRLEQMGAMSLVQATRSGGGRQTPASQRRADVTVLDITGGAASVRLAMSDWIDYMHLARWKGRWVIVNVLWELTPKTQGAGARTPGSEHPSLIDPTVVARVLDSVVPAAMRAEMIPGAAVTVVEGSRVLLARGYGVANLATKQPVSADSTIWRIGSISKIMTATAVVQLADRGRLDLHADVNRYLHRVRVPPMRGAGPITPWHLLTHSAGLDELRPGTQAERQDAVLPLDRFLTGKLVRVHPPGEITSYSTYAATLAGLLVEEVSGLPFKVYLERELWRPLGMLHTSISIPPPHRRLVATGYDVEGSRPHEAHWEWYHTIPASSVNATASDMARFMAAHLSGGALDGVRVLSDSATAAMQRRQLTMHPRMPGWGLGWQEDELRGWRLVQHGGDVAGFSALLTLVPTRNLGIFVVSHREASDLRFVVRDALLRELLPARGGETVASTASRAAHAGDYVGRYRASVACHTCPGGGPPVPTLDVATRDDRSLTISGQRWIEVDTDLFQAENGRRIGFRRDAAGRVTHLTMGSWKVMERMR